MANDREKAIIVGLEDIDNNRAEYSGKKAAEQRKRLGAALDKAEASLHRKDKLLDSVPVDGTRLRIWLMDIGSRYQKGDNKPGDIFSQGSDMLTDAYLKQLGYSKQTKPIDAPNTSRSSMPAQTHPEEASELEASAVSGAEDDPSPEFSLLTSSSLSSAPPDDILAQEAEAYESGLQQAESGPRNPTEALLEPRLVDLEETVTKEKQAEASIAPDSAEMTVIDDKNPDPPEPNVEESPSGIATERSESRTVEQPSGHSQSLLGAHGHEITAPSPAKQIRPTPELPSLGSKKRAPDSDELSGPHEKRQRKNAANDHSREITGMPAPIREGNAVGMLVDLNEGLPRQPHRIPNLNSPAGRNIDDRVAAMKICISSAGEEYCRQCVDGLDGKPALVPAPTKRLEQLYVTLFGDMGSWKACAAHVPREAYDGSSFLEGVIGAAVYRMVFRIPVPWGSPWDEIERFKADGRAPYFERAAKDLDLSHANQDFLIVRAAQLQISDTRFQNSTIRPIAKSLAEELAMFLYPQLEVMQISISRPGASFWNTMSAALVDVFTEGLIIRGLLDAAPIEYRYTWIPSGQKYDEKKFMSHRPVSDGLVGEVSFSITPLVECRQEPSSAWRVVSRARGFLKMWTGERRPVQELAAAGDSDDGPVCRI